jgi:cephalosporin-C deacetylase-like acetyl esterase
MIPLVAFLTLVLAGGPLLIAQAPSSEDLTVRRQVAAEGPRITDFLRYQVGQAWRQDDLRLQRLNTVKTEEGLRELQNELGKKLLKNIGGLPESKAALNTRLIGTIQQDGYRIEKIIFESSPGFYVPALVWIPDGIRQPAPAVLVPCGHATNGKIHYQYICQRLAKRGYIAISWDPVGQGERSQFWDVEKNSSRYNLVCGEHAILGNLAYLVGANLARWEIWDGIRALDYLLTRADVDPQRISITGTSGGGFQAAHIAALDPRIQTVAPSCYISSLPMRMNNRIFKDPDSDPEQDIYRMVSDGIDHAGLLLLAYPRPVILAAAVEDFFPIEGTRRAFHEVASVYRRLGMADRIAMVEGYHRHQFSVENLQAVFTFLDRFNQMPIKEELESFEKLDDELLRCTKAGQVSLEIADARPMVELIKDYYEHTKAKRHRLADLYRDNHPGIETWKVTPYRHSPSETEIAWSEMGSLERDSWKIDKYLLHHSLFLSLPVIHVYKPGSDDRKTLLWFRLSGKLRPEDWPEITGYLDRGYQVLSFDFRGLGENRLLYQTVSVDDPALVQRDFDAGYADPVNSVLANYVYNTLLVGRPYFLQMIEDAQIVQRFAKEKLKAGPLSVAGREEAQTLAWAISECLPETSLLPTPDGRIVKWSEIVDTGQEIWPIHFLLPGGAWVE